MLRGPVYETFFVMFLAFGTLNVHLHNRFITGTVIREYYDTFPRTLLGVMSGGYVLTIFGNVAFVSMGFLQFEDLCQKFGAINVHIEIIMNFAILLYLIDSYIVKYKTFFKKKPMLSYFFYLFVLLGVYASFVVPEMFYRGNYAIHPSAWVSLGTTSANLVLSIFVWFSTKRQSTAIPSDATVTPRLQAHLAQTTAANMMLLTALRWVISVSWVVIPFFPIKHTSDTDVLCLLILGVCRCMEATMFPILFLYHYKGIKRNFLREEARKTQNAAPMTTIESDGGSHESYEGTEGIKRLYATWKGDYERSKKKQEVGVESREVLLRQSSISLD
ncbi:hypothetical protein B9Z55_019220 [Caenorhabditis nigoni]|uniref:Uncharacterized protein n=1 Tax=Caenorhabditis nigoni TaxID=1611254 RepID=A0A2G5THG0_9PELO|nr:hypothetical protein B9Z55_019220 [Caenorhabditis nigoni]